ncbi:hypothetical protein RFI_16413 [Reticulomyxa filosa]|uniref:Uncharacterized protein n=1 Tax=Reticulomyxa filosa TaxID=46433 RepID=X6N3E7_RETFI|nr:hypothetical protein RFI_16413 [Reticulomyxa filosa]|eukprot:ETO20805.1 hypothetical protein RFI_16413 [Reticulomyxa filosa]
MCIRRVIKVDEKSLQVSIEDYLKNQLEMDLRLCYGLGELMYVSTLTEQMYVQKYDKMHGRWGGQSGEAYFTIASIVGRMGVLLHGDIAANEVVPVTWVKPISKQQRQQLKYLSRDEWYDVNDFVLKEYIRDACTDLISKNHKQALQHLQNVWQISVCNDDDELESKDPTPQSSLRTAGHSSEITTKLSLLKDIYADLPQEQVNIDIEEFQTAMNTLGCLSLSLSLFFLTN